MSPYEAMEILATESSLNSKDFFDFEKLRITSKSRLVLSGGEDAMYNFATFIWPSTSAKSNFSLHDLARLDQKNFSLAIRIIEELVAQRFDRSFFEYL